MAIDDTRLRDLLEQSHDLHSDAMTTTRTSARRVRRARARRASVTASTSTRRRCAATTLLGGLPKSGVLAAAGLGTAMVALLASPGVRRQDDGRADAADRGVDREPRGRHLRHRAHARLHRWCERERGGEGVREKTKDQHQEHAEAFNAAVDPARRQGAGPARPGAARRGEQRQAVAHRARRRSSTSPSSSRTAPRRPTWPTPARTPNKNARAVAASIMGVEAQHVAILNAVKALVAGGAADLIALPPDAAKLPAAAGSVGFPNAFYPTTDARPANEGAVQ